MEVAGRLRGIADVGLGWRVDDALMVFRVRLEVAARSDWLALRSALHSVGPLVFDDFQGLGLSLDAVSADAAVKRAQRIVRCALEGATGLTADDVVYGAQEWPMRSG